MERASSGSTGSPPNSSESTYGLKFGKKIYFEDVGIGVQPKLSGGSSSVSGYGNPSSSPVPVKKVKNGGASLGNGNINNPPRCQVEGCKVDLSDVKAYYSRHKVCAMHSKSPKVIVSGLEQRFCQQCSRFHQLTEFDQGKRSCRRRLAGHNERRRKPPPGSLMPSRYGRLSSSVFETSGRGGSGGFLMDFSSHQRLTDKNIWRTTRSPERVAGNQAAVNGKFPSNSWENNNESPPSNLFLQGSSNRNGFPPAPSFPLGDFFAGVSDSGCALSLLSNQQWGSSRPRASDLEVSDFDYAEDATFGNPQAPQVASGTHFSTTLWAYKGNEVASNSHEMGSELGLVQMSQPHNSQFSSEFEPSQRNGRQYMEHEHSSKAAYGSPSHHVHWSL